MQLKIRIQSFSGIITNSSSEVFSIRTESTKEELKALIKAIHEDFLYKGNWSDYHNLEQEEKDKYDHYSGDGGRIDVENFEDRYKNYLKYWVPEDKKELYTKEIYSLTEDGSLEEQQKTLKVYLDEGFTRTLDWIIKNLYVIDIECESCVKNTEGRVLKLLPWNEDSYIVDENGNKIEE